MTNEEIKVLSDFASYLDKQKNDITPKMWAEKVVWKSPNSFQVWLEYYLQQLKQK